MSFDSLDGDIVVYIGDDGKPRIDVKFQGDTAWLTQSQLVDLFQSSKANISEHISNIYAEGELQAEATVRKFRTVRSEGDRQVAREIEHYNLDMIISLGYRVKSKVATKFRIWATDRLREYIVKGFAMDDERLKGNGSGNYWKELLDRIRDIRSSEKVLYRQVLDLYSTSVDYDPKSEESTKFFATVQNKLHYATNEQTAAELISSRADGAKDFMGLTTFAGEMPTLKESKTAKNYLTKDELFRLNRLVSAFFDLAELRAQERQSMYMKDWISELDKFSEIYGKGKLKNAGTRTHAQAVKKAEVEYRKYQERTLSPVEKDYLESIKAIEKIAEDSIKGADNE